MNHFVLLTSQIVQDGGKDLFSNSWTTGDLNAISGLVDKLGGFAMWVISAIGFCIVIFSILKNAISGLYVLAPDIWNKVDELKGDADVNSAKAGLKGGEGGASKKLGSAFSLLLAMLPNVRQLTEFNDDEIDVKSIDKKMYFMKAIPALVAQIFIGMLIFYGTPAKLANWIGTGATYAVEVVLSNADPITVIQGFSESFVDVKLATDGSNSPMEKVVNEATREAVPIINSTYKDILKESLQTSAYTLESTLLDYITHANGMSDTIVSPGYTTNITASYYPNTPTYSSDYKPVSVVDNTGALSTTESVKVWLSTASNGTLTYTFSVAMSSLNTGSTMVKPNDHIVWRVTCTPVAVTSASVSEMTLYTGGKISVTSLANNDIIAVPSIKYGGSPTTEGVLEGSLGACTVHYTTKVNGVEETKSVYGSLERVGGVASNDNRLRLITQKGAIPSADVSNITMIEIVPNTELKYTILKDKLNHSYNIRNIKFGKAENDASVTCALTSWADYSSTDSTGVSPSKIPGSGTKADAEKAQ